MTLNEAEEVYMAWQVGFETDVSKIAEALLVIKSAEVERQNEPPEFDL